MSSTEPSEVGVWVDRLRQEAASVKDCVTRFFFQSVALYVAAVGALSALALQAANPSKREMLHVHFAAFPLIVLITASMRICTHKYATANRAAGYQLHLSRRAALSACGEPVLDWEEALLAWRVVQATYFQHLFWSSRDHGLSAPKASWRAPFHRLCPGPWRIDHANSKQRPTLRYWFEADSFVGDGAEYHAGGYLRGLLEVLRALCWLLSVGVLVLGVIALSLELWAIAVPALLHGVLLCVWTGQHARREFNKLVLLEGSFLSIHGCASMWELCRSAHAFALWCAGSSAQTTKYMRCLGQFAREWKDVLVVAEENAQGTPVSCPFE